MLKKYFFKDKRLPNSNLLFLRVQDRNINYNNIEYN